MKFQKNLMKILKKQGIKFKLNTKVEKITKNNNFVSIDNC